MYGDTRYAFEAAEEERLDEYVDVRAEEYSKHMDMLLTLGNGANDAFLENAK
jgi:hypothetical protein